MGEERGMRNDSVEDSWSDEEDWSETEGETNSIPCPECGGEVYEEADACPHCGYFLEDAAVDPMLGKPWWFVVLGILGIIATVFALFGGF
jgi:hypothetical protein